MGVAAPISPSPRLHGCAPKVVTLALVPFVMPASRLLPSRAKRELHLVTSLLALLRLLVRLGHRGGPVRHVSLRTARMMPVSPLCPVPHPWSRCMSTLRLRRLGSGRMWLPPDVRALSVGTPCHTVLIGCPSRLRSVAFVPTAGGDGRLVPMLPFFYRYWNGPLRLPPWSPGLDGNARRGVMLAA